MTDAQLESRRNAYREYLKSEKGKFDRFMDKLHLQHLHEEAREFARNRWKCPKCMNQGEV